VANAEIIAIVAIVAGLITTLATLVSSYFTNRANIVAKRSELAFEKRLEAFREIYAAMTEANSHLQSYLWLSNGLGVPKMINIAKTVSTPEDSIVKQLHYAYINARPDFVKVYTKNRIYLPPHVDNLIQSYMDGVLFDILGKNEQDYLPAFLETAPKVVDKLTVDVVREMHHFIGYK
jgi:hypothetical protein